ncbi:hypothetical protein ACM01_31685 [Streptomyces viridochromogenes]|uniref:Uncharacterized protein n=1 Tax=Streptomyces viridochromogenes TaxID=1938 RepID=A0A0J7Z4C3_STRVR|nr:WD40 repeat domain-containing protein [Streptomyces viridochromogenes]KMS70392.1 hypothetical protein ACM01_31685 [Streptomyces viridochromogenes]KOG19432.1 hypothetical protein ADK36_19700 [Streptomyces viridochromogenes]KOG19930.1 hypothetical protein ADK35_19065 [Streptomyces viridochromogenes]
MTWSALNRARRRLIRRVLLVSTAVTCAGLGGWMLIFSDENDSAFVATVGSLFVGLVTLFLALVDFFRQEPAPLNPAALADDLALVLKEQWLEEATARGLRDPRVLPLAWKATERAVTHLPRTANARTLRMRLNGRLDGRFDETTSRLAHGYTQLPNGRLVAIGEPGSGKSVLAILLTLGLLGTREAGGPVPVLLTASSWDPVRQPLDDWIITTLAEPHYSGRPEIPRALLTHGLLVPVLDGLDEIPESARRSAIRGINAAIGAERPVVVTCRAAEYEDLIRGGAPTLREAPVIEVCPVAPGDAIAYLRDVDWPAGTDWTPVYAHLRSEPGSPVATALSTPLMVTSARLVHERLGLDPAELLDRSRFDCQYAVEQHLTEHLVDAAYAPHPRLPDSGRDGRWTAEQARRWLTFLACYLHDHRERDLAWWRMSERLLKPWFAPALGVVAGLVLGIGSVAWIMGTRALGENTTGALPVIAGSVAGGFALLSTIVWYTAPGRPPGRLLFSVQGSMGRLRRGFRNGAMLTAFAVAPVLVGVTSFVALDSEGGAGSFGAVEFYYEMVMTGLSLLIIIGLALAAHNWLNAPPHHATQVSPTNSVTQDRASALTGAAVAGSVVAATGLLGWYAGVFTGAWLNREVNDWVGWPGIRNLALLAPDKWHAVMETFGDHTSVRVGLTVALPGTVFALLLLLTRAWPRFVLVRLFLAARRRLPLRLMEFLADARRRELLRQSGGVYQFRHVRLQETLAGRPTYTDGHPDATSGRILRRRVVLTAGAATAITAAVGSSTRDESFRVFPAHTELTALAFIPGQQTSIAVGAADGSVWLWDYEEHPLPLGKHQVRGKPRHEPAVRGLAHHPFRPQLIVSDDAATEVWHTKNRVRTKRLLKNREGSPDVKFSHQGELLIVSEGKVLRLWKTGNDHEFTGTPVSHEVAHNSGGTASLLFDPEGRPVTLDDTGRVWRHSVPSLEREGQPLAETRRKGEDNRYYDLSANWRHGLLAFDTGDGADGEYRAGLWTRSSREAPWRETPWCPAAYVVAVSPTAPILAAVDRYEHTVHIWHCPYGEPVRTATLRGHTGLINTLAFSPGGELLATVSADRTLRLWQTDPSWLDFRAGE